MAHGVEKTKVPEMNGVSLRKYGDFTEKWKLVTVRFREDTREMRFTYANRSAYSALLKGDKYKDGDIFAKVGLIVGEDSFFPTSVVPSGVRRFQFMVRNEKKFADTDGWGYALFKSDGQLFPGSIKEQAMACAACHRTVKEKQYVFSDLAKLSPFLKHESVNVNEPKQNYSFVSTDPSTAPELIRKLLPMEAKYVSEFKGDATAAVFRGTFDEIQPLLVRNTIQKNTSTFYISDSQDGFLLTVPEKSIKTCSGPAGKRKVKAVSIYLRHRLELCQDE